MPRLLINAALVPEGAVELRAGVNTFGRAPTNDFPIEHASVSSHHCVLSMTSNLVVVRDLDSTNGTFIDDQRVIEANFSEGQTLRLGEVELLWEVAPVSVVIPALERVEVPQPVVLPNGVLSCINHHSVAATRRCPQCQRVFCEACIHHLRIAGQKMHNLCPSCSAECEWIDTEAVKKKSLLDKIWQAVDSRLNRT